jgi:hypothetical protein
MTSKKKMEYRITLIIFMIFSLNGCNDNPVEVKSENRSPIIFSLIVFPDIIGPTDSAIVICNAIDPDGDTLVYDWITDGKSKDKRI